MAKVKSVWYCNECGHKSFKWVGQCPACLEWNTLNEEKELPESHTRFDIAPKEKARPQKVKEVILDETKRVSTDLSEFDRLIGGGVVPGSLTLVGGQPGIGKSTLLLQVSQSLAKKGLKVLYVSGEESAAQTSLRAKRLGVDSDNLYILSETLVGHICDVAKEMKPDLLIVDSIQIVYKGEIQSAPGSVSQVRECTTQFMHFAKSEGIATFLVGHVTKSGDIAGPKVLEHLVDTVLYFEGDKQHNFRMIRAFKNRFGPTDEVAVFQMAGHGLVEVKNPSQIFLQERKKNVAGSVVVPTLEGTRPILVEVQSLVTPTVFSSPSRRVTGVENNRLLLILAVMEKRLRFPLHKMDVFVSIAGGLHIVEPAIDLGILFAVASSMKNVIIDPTTTMIGEVGLSGEVRNVSRLELRLKEAKSMGFCRAIVPMHSRRGLTDEVAEGLDLIEVEMVDEAFRALSPYKPKKQPAPPQHASV